MGLIQSLFKRRRVDDRMAGSGYRFFFGQSISGKNVNEQTAMQLSTVFACVRVLSESVASLPLHVYEKDANGNRKKAEDSNLYFLLHDEPNDEMSSYSFRETMMMHLLLYGNAYAQILRNGRGEVLGLYPLLPNRITMERDDNGRLFYRYIRYDPVEPPKSKETTVILDASQVLHIPGLSMDGLVGLSPIAACRNAIGSGLAADEYSGKYFSNGAAPMGVLEHPGLIKDPEKLRESWNAAYGGSHNAGKVAILEEGLKFAPISVSPQDAQLLETRKFSVTEICRIFRVPPHLVQDLERATFSNIEQQSLDFVMYSLMPYLTRWEQALTKSLLSREEKKKFEIRFNVDALLRGSHKERYDAYAQGVNNGFLCPNDIRKLENLDLIPDEEGGNDFYIQGAMVPLRMAGVTYQKQSAGQSTGDTDPSSDVSTDQAETDEDQSSDADKPASDNVRHSGRKRSRADPVKTGSSVNDESLKYTDMVW